MANRIKATVLIVLPATRHPLDGEDESAINCKCKRPGIAVKVTGGNIERCFCEQCLYDYIQHYQFGGGSTLYGTTK